MYKKNEVEKIAIEYFQSEIAANVWVSKYALKIDEDNFIELSPDDTLIRLTKEIVRIENNYKNPIGHDIIYNLFKNYNKVVLGGSCLFGVGNNLTLSTIGNCFTLPSPDDSCGGIFKVNEEIAQIEKRRGGVGLDLSTIRPRYSNVNNAASTSTGVVPFMELFSTTTRTIAQEGRRGALMLSLDIKHPDSPEFITSKDDLSKITGANISVKITDEFMKAVEKDEIYRLNYQNKIELEISALRLWNTLIHQAWKSAEPGILFWDRIIEESPADCYLGFKTITTNPCSELPMSEYGDCILLTINLYAYIVNPFTRKAYFDIESYKEDVKLAQRILDDIIDLEHEKIHNIIDKILSDPEPKDTKKTELNLWSEIHDKLMISRRTGLGIMGLADAGAALGLRYADNKFISFAEEVSRITAISSYMSSIDLAEERGTFTLFDTFKEKNNPFIIRILSNLPMKYLKKYDRHGRRNIANLTIAPTGSISILAGVSNGIEPVYAIEYIRKRKVSTDNPNKKFQDKQCDWWEEYKVLHSGFKNWFLGLPKFAEWDNEIPIKQNLSELNDPSALEYYIKESPYYKSTAYEIDNNSKLLLQSKIQPWVDHSISITYNLLKTATEQEVNNLYMSAWKLGCKGITVYRDGCRQGILTTDSTFKPGSFNQHDALKRPRDLLCDIYNVMAKGKSWKIFVGLIDNMPYEIFAIEGDGKLTIEQGILRKVHKGRYDLLTISEEIVMENITEVMSNEEEALTRAISWALRHGAKLEFGVDQLNKSQGNITSFSKAIARTLKKYINYEYRNLGNNNCPTCNSILISEGGCLQCVQCGYSKCE